MRVTVCDVTDEQFLSQLQPRIATNLTAVGSVQATALQLTSEINIIATAAAGTGVRLADAMRRREVINRSTNDVLVYPPVNAQFEQMTVNLAVTVHAGSNATFTPSSSFSLVIT
jgi:hypothetical protein